MSTLLRRGNGKPASLLRRGNGDESRSAADSRARRALVVLLCLCGLLLGAGGASAEPPFRIPTQITDHVSALAGKTANVQTALTNLQNEDNVQLWVVYVDSFSGQDGNVWANSSGTRSGFGSDTLLLAIATGDRAYGYYAPSGFPLDANQVRSIEQRDIVPKLKSEDWSGAAVAAADGLRTAIGSSPSSGSSSWILWVVLLALVIGGYLWYRSARKKSGAHGGTNGSQGATAADPAADGPPAEPLEPLQSVSDRSVQTLISTDNAVRASEQQLTLAESTFGAAAMTDFRKAFEDARSSLAAAFQLCQKIDDEVPEDEATRRAWMAEIIQRCSDADGALDAQSERFDAMLDLKNRLPAAIAEVKTAIPLQDARVADATGTLARLSSTYAPSALRTVISNASEASNRLEFARSSISQASGEDTAADTTPAVVAARAAQESVAQAKTLLDGIDKLSADLAQAAAALPSKLEPVQGELSTARAAFGQGGTGGAATSIAQRLDQVETTLTAAAGPDGARDPILATQRVREADATLDEILAATRSAQQSEQRAATALQQSLESAQAKITGAGDFISTRRGAVGSQARTRLAEAERHLTNAMSLALSDAAAAYAESQQAEAMADEAARLAQNDVGRWQGPGGGGFGAVASAAEATAAATSPARSSADCWAACSAEAGEGATAAGSAGSAAVDSAAVVDLAVAVVVAESAAEGGSSFGLPLFVVQRGRNGRARQGLPSWRTVPELPRFES